MNKIELRNLLKALEKNYKFHPKFVEEFSDLITNTGIEKQILELFFNRTMTMKKLSPTDHVKWLEPLKGHRNMYSLHLDAKTANYRALLTRDINGNVFLCMFFERQGKKETSYEKHIQKAIERRKEM